MECNRDEATRAKEIAERKFTARDMEGAKKFALKAHQLYPNLDGITQMLSTFDVYLAAEKKVNGEMDWYSILCVSSSADDESVKKQYRKLALILHPDKNKSIGADGAFKLLSEAWSVLSDKGRRAQYDMKRNSSVKVVLPQKTAQNSKPSPQPEVPNGFYNFTTNASSNVRPQTSNVRAKKSAARSVNQPPPKQPPPNPPPRQAKPGTFWTSCNRCKMQYEYLRCYVNHNLLCPNCHEPFLAVEIGTVPSNGSNSNMSWSFSHQRGQDHHQSGKQGPSLTGRHGFPSNPAVDSLHNVNFQWGPFSRAAGVASANASSSAAAAAVNMVQHTYDKVRREREEAQAAARSEEIRRKVSGKRGVGAESCQEREVGDRPAKKRSIDGEEAVVNNINGGLGADIVSGFGVNSVHRYFGVKSNVHESERANGTYKEFFNGMDQDANKAYRAIPKPSTGAFRELSVHENRNLLMDKARSDIQKKLQEWNMKARASKEEKVTLKVVSGSSHQLKSNGPKREKKQATKVKAPSNAPNDVLDPEQPEPVTISVIDPDFHDFDNDRSEKCFEENQVWAAYDDDDGMPRYYAMIQKVLSLNPFKMRISWLNSKSNAELGPINWVGSGFTKTCGDFRVGRYELNKSVNVFSHMVKWEKGLRGVIRIVPRKSEVWALYRNWSKDWNESTPDEVIYKYDMVEVLDDYLEEVGLTVAPLLKVVGFKTVFYRNMDPDSVQKIPREEMFRFSHQVPSWVLREGEAENAPKGCRELDPAATPSELLQVILNAKIEEKTEAIEQ
ncbi:hypothetical protein AMTRI_Chr06g171480 [Amborella trichopoda]